MFTEKVWTLENYVFIIINQCVCVILKTCNKEHNPMVHHPVSSIGSLGSSVICDYLQMDPTRKLTQISQESMNHENKVKVM